MTGPQKTALDHLSAKELKTIEREQGKGAYLDLIKKLGSTPVGPKISRELEEKDDIAELIQRLLTEEEKLHVRARKDERDVIGELLKELEKKERQGADPIGDLIRERLGKEKTLSQEIAPPRDLLKVAKELSTHLHIDKNIKSRLARAYENYQKLTPDLRRDIRALSSLLSLSHIHVLAVLANESNMNPEARSPAGAKGLPQLMPGTKSGIIKFVSHGKTTEAGPEERYFALLGRNQHFMNIYKKGGYSQEVAIGISYLAYLSKKYGDDRALRVYNGGPRYPDNEENLSYPKRVRDFFVGFRTFQENKIL